MSRIMCFLMVTILAVVSCKKNNSSPGPGAPSTVVLRPATMTFFEGAIGGGGPVWTFEYDAQNRLTRFGKEKENLRSITGDKSRLELFYADVEATTDYAYFGEGNLRVNLHDSTMSPHAVSIQTSIYNTTFNQTTYQDVIEWRFGYNLDHQLTEEVTSAGSGLEVHYFYDDNKQLQKFEFSSLFDSYWRANTRTTITGYDNHPSPFAHVTGYRWASYPQFYNDQYAQAFCYQNPTQMLSEFWSASKNDFYVAETTNFNYTYNDQGYPTKIVVSTSYTPEGGQSTGALKTYEFTYK